jgi:type III restriction enzyme
VKLILKDFQEEAVQQLLGHVVSARQEATRGIHQALSLAAPTGSGKTVVMTALIEEILEGDDATARDPDAVFLWLTDQPELNEQTRQKMIATSSVLSGHQLVVVDAAIDQPALFPGKVYFLNTQKLAKNSSLVRHGDDRTYTLWQWLTRTIRERPTSFYLIIDEAHRGMHEAKETEAANSIIQKFIKGSSGEIPAVPIIMGVSATPERFDQVISGTTRVRRPVSVDIERVRASGLLKDVVDLFHPDEQQHSDMTMLRAAARAWREYDQRWNSYSKSEGLALVRPLLMVQVQDGTESKLSRTDLDQVLRVLRDEMGNPPTEWFAHAFQEGSPIKADGSLIRYLAPSAIEADPSCRVVLFKTSLTTGWDCPRAEVMMSFRSAKDDTLIAQLVGRMVRAPLARAIERDEHLNTVALYLPHYDRAGLSRVVERLSAGDPTLLPPTRTREGRTVVDLVRNSQADACFAVFEDLPSYVVPRARRGSQVRRLGRLASLLARWDVDQGAPDFASKTLVTVLTDELQQRKDTEQFKSIVREGGLLDVRQVSWRYDPAKTRENTVQVEISPENVDDIFQWVGRRFGEGLHVEYWKARVAAGASNHLRTKLEAYALASTPDVIARLERDAQAEVRRLLGVHREAIKKLPEEARQAFRDVRGLSTEPELSPLIAPEEIDTVAADTTWNKHLFVDSDGTYPCKLNTWETPVMQAELADDAVVGWLRNPPRKPWSLCIPYEMDGIWKPCFPDFLVFRQSESGIKVDIVDPHLLSFDDAWHRAVGIAKYAERHTDAFRRVAMIMLDGKEVIEIDLSDDDVRRRVRQVSSNEHLRELFASSGTKTRLA